MPSDDKPKSDNLEPSEHSGDATPTAGGIARLTLPRIQMRGQGPDVGGNEAHMTLAPAQIQAHGIVGGSEVDRAHPTAQGKTPSAVIATKTVVVGGATELDTAGSVIPKQTPQSGDFVISPVSPRYGLDPDEPPPSPTDTEAPADRLDSDTLDSLAATTVEAPTIIPASGAAELRIITHAPNVTVAPGGVSAEAAVGDSSVNDPPRLVATARDRIRLSGTVPVRVEAAKTSSLEALQNLRESLVGMRPYDMTASPQDNRAVIAFDRETYEILIATIEAAIRLQETKKTTPKLAAAIRALRDQLADYRKAWEEAKALGQEGADLGKDIGKNILAVIGALDVFLALFGM